MKLRPGLFGTNMLGAPGLSSAAGGTLAFDGFEEAWPSALPWTNELGAWETASGKASPSALAGFAVATVSVGTSDGRVQADAVRNGNSVGVVARWADSSNYLRGQYNGAQFRLIEAVSNSTRILVDQAVTYVPGATIAVVVSGTYSELHYNGVLLGSASDLNVALVGGKFGLYSSNLANTLDNFSVTSV